VNYKFGYDAGPYW